MIVTTAPGTLVRDPVTKLALEPGADIDPNDPYFARAIADGDLLPADQTVEPGAAPEENPPTGGRPPRAKASALPSSDEDKA
ncbi:DUF2635 domain-containing protein [Sphingomonas sp. CBMAI 2297]|uniref:DUF2635 domain-containing protein n=1 Tax=Sphingomonas sp. CBMAI 2297 TaxID=2991720 RepID=UPI002457F1A1|nr:DUF2635 domain-containing protein [Sphingomonas sp. CBMAI 2297]MDH4745825.1 DUF2635 domain-containing protein [Sphingomonas sp. CBMAI 2297]